MLLVDEGGTLLHGLLRVEKGRQLLVLHLDQVEGLPGDLRVDGGHRGHLIPEGADLPRLEGRVVLVHAELERGNQGAREHRLYPGQPFRPGRIDARDPAVGNGAVEDFAVEHPRQRHILYVGRAPRHLRGGVFLRDPLSYGIELHGHLPAEAARMASMINAYPVHLHRFPSMPSLISSSVGRAFSWHRA